MHAWTSQAGFPLLEASVENSGLSLKQSRFFINSSSKAAQEESTLWPVPLLASKHLDQDTLINTEASLTHIKADSFKLNQGQSGFYRVVYNATHVRTLSNLIKRGRVSAPDRLGLISDMFEAAKSGHIETTDALTLLNAYSEETDAAVWEIIASQLASLRATMDDEPLRETMKPFVRKLVSKQLKRLGWHPVEGEPYFDTLLRPTILGMAAVADEPEVVKEALRLFAAIEHPDDIEPELRSSESNTKVRRGSDLNPDLRGVVYGTAVRLGGKKEFDKLLAMHNTSTHSEERTTIAAALTGFKQPALIKSALSKIDTPDVRLQDVAYWLAYSFINRHAKQATWEWMVSHWDWLEENLGSDLSFYRMPVYAARSYSDRSFLKTYKSFFEKVLSPSLERSYRQGIETIEWQADWKKRDLKTIKHYFE
jgi:aminopeptidase 2